MYNNHRWDLVDAYKKDKKVVEKVRKETLPDSLQTLEDAALLSLIEQKTKERDQINAKIRELGVERSKYITQNKSSTSEKSLGEEMIKTIQKEATKNGFKL